MVSTARTRLAALALLPVALLLSACRLDMGITVAETGETTMVIDFIDDEGTFSSLSMTCDDLADESGEDVSEYSIEDLSDNGELHCRLTNKNTESFDVEHNDDGTITIVDPGDVDTLNGFDEKLLTITLSITMPGNIISASGHNTIDGNTVIYTGAAVFTEGFTITSETSGSLDPTVSEDPASGNTPDVEATDYAADGYEYNESDDDGEGIEKHNGSTGFIVAAGVVAVATLIGIAIAVLHSRKKF